MPSTSSQDAENSVRLAKLDRWATLLDTRFNVLGFKVGWDSILGLVPLVGDAVTVVPAAVMIHHGYKAGVRKRALARMVWNTGVDLTLGTIPLVGDIFDFAFKSHKKNVAVLRSELERIESARA